jgi:hypothetical protein
MMNLKTFKLLFLSAVLLCAFSGTAKEGMYLPMLLKKINASDMEALGMQISPEEIYAVNKESLKDAIVHFGGGCTAELVSSQGLLLTNHHCGYRNIQKHSTVEHDYLTDGFWASSMDDELPNKGLTATILQRMTDVTSQVLNGVTEEMSEQERNVLIQKNIKGLIDRDVEDKFHKIEVRAFYYGNQYIMMESIVFRDVRLVGAPPSNIGKFGGDTDNWMWPRHTGDFSVFRIYANSENKPADYAKDNIPYKPKKHLQISLNGYNMGDFTMVFGYPGRTQEYLPAAAIEMITQKINPYRIDLRTQKLDIMRKYMEKDKKIRIQYSAKYAGVANGWKKWQGENRGIKRLNTINAKKADEDEFMRWAIVHHPEYEQLIPTFNQTYQQLIPWQMGVQYYAESGYYYDFVRYVIGFSRLVDMSQADDKDEAKVKEYAQYLAKGVEAFYKDFNQEVEKELLVATINSYLSFPYDEIPTPDYLNIIRKKYKGDAHKWVEKMAKKSMFFNTEKLTDFLQSYSSKKATKLEKDLLYKLAISYYSNYGQNLLPGIAALEKSLDSLQRIYMKAQLEMNDGQYLFPDANSTLRVSYGQVDNYDPRDGVEYTYFTTLKGIMEKENPDIYDYVVEKKLKQLYKNKDYAPYGDNDGTMHVCFIASNHTTGGNSGSPVLNAKGQLIGLNFDRNWEGTMSDLDYDPDQCRNITLDIRYCLFIIDKFAGAERLIQEMDIVKN